MSNFPPQMRRPRRLRRALVSLAGVAVLSAASAGPASAAAVWAPALPLQPMGGVYVSAFPDGSAFAMRTDNNNNGLLYVSRDFGATWTAKLPPSSAATMKMEMGGPQVGYMTSGDVLIKTVDAFDTWAEIQLPTRRPTMEALAVARGGRTVAIGGRRFSEGEDCNPYDDPALVSASHDGGRTWRTHAIRVDGAGVSALSFLDGRHGLALLSEIAPGQDACDGGAFGVLGGRVVATRDGGRTWKLAYDCLQANRRRWSPDDPSSYTDVCTSIGMASPRHFAVGTRSGTIAVTWNGGRTWLEQRLDSLYGDLPDNPGETNAIRWVSGIDFVDDRVGYLSTTGRGVWRTEDGGRTWLREPSTHEAYGPVIADLAAADAEHVIAGGPNFVIRRIPELTVPGVPY